MASTGHATQAHTTFWQSLTSCCAKSKDQITDFGKRHYEKIDQTTVSTTVKSHDDRCARNVAVALLATSFVVALFGALVFSGSIGVATSAGPMTISQGFWTMVGGVAGFGATVLAIAVHACKTCVANRETGIRGTEKGANKTTTVTHTTKVDEKGQGKTEADSTVV